MNNIANIEDYLKEHENKDMLRFLTCGSVDDGKSTLIGRMLYDSKMVFDDANDAWYKSTPKEDEIQRYIEANGLTTANDFLHCFALGSGLHANKEFMEIVEKHMKSRGTEPIIIDLTNFIRRNFLKISKPLKTIFSYSSFNSVAINNLRNFICNLR